MKLPAQEPRMAQLGSRDPGRREGLCPGRFLGGRSAFPQIGPTRGYKVAWNAVEREPKECAGLPARPSILSARRRGTLRRRWLSRRVVRAKITNAGKGSI